MVWEVYRYVSKGWIASYYINPDFHFTYYGFGWVRPWPAPGCTCTSPCWGWRRSGSPSACSTGSAPSCSSSAFTYVFLLDQARYLNHFYLISLIAFLLVSCPSIARCRSTRTGGRRCARTRRRPGRCGCCARRWGSPTSTAALAKLNGDWLRGEPIRAWLAGAPDFPVLGRYFTEEWMVYAFAYGGLLLDLLDRAAPAVAPTRPFAFAVGVVVPRHQRRALPDRHLPLDDDGGHDDLLRAGLAAPVGLMPARGGRPARPSPPEPRGWLGAARPGAAAGLAASRAGWPCNSSSPCATCSTPAT